MGVRVAVVGATGGVGREVLQALAERRFPADEVVALASERSAGGMVSFGEQDLRVDPLASHDFAGIDLALFAADARVAREHAPRAARAGARVVDGSSAFRLEPRVALVSADLDRGGGPGERGAIVAVPGAVAGMVATALRPLRDLAPLRRVVIATYESVAGAGKAAMDELFDQTRAVYVNQPIEREHFTKQIAFNVIPHVEAFGDDGFTAAETALAAELRKLLGAELRAVATCVRVPVFIGVAAAVTVEFAGAIDEAAARRAWRGWGAGEAIGATRGSSTASPSGASPTTCAGARSTSSASARRWSRADGS
jgi:aspartate-semialdehyde dehydrogenase